MCSVDSSLAVQMGDKCCSLLLLLATAFLAQTTVAQYACACVRPLTAPCPTATFATPAIPTAANFPTQQLTGFLPQAFLPQYCQPQAFVPPGILPPIYQPPAIVVPIPPPPKDCRSANTTVHHHEPPPPCAGHAPHPPVVVQSVYVGRKEDDDEDKKEKCRNRKKERHDDSNCNDEEEEHEDNNGRDVRPQRRSSRRSRPQRRNVMRMHDPMDYYSPRYYEEPIIIGDPYRGDCCSDCCCGFPSRVIYID